VAGLLGMRVRDGASGFLLGGRKIENRRAEREMGEASTDCKGRNTAGVLSFGYANLNILKGKGGVAEGGSAGFKTRAKKKEGGIRSFACRGVTGTSMVG